MTSINSFCENTELSCHVSMHSRCIYPQALVRRWQTTGLTSLSVPGWLIVQGSWVGYKWKHLAPVKFGSPGHALLAVAAMSFASCLISVPFRPECNIAGERSSVLGPVNCAKQPQQKDPKEQQPNPNLQESEHRAARAACIPEVCARHGAEEALLKGRRRGEA